METLAKHFGSFFKRSILPSSILVLIILFFSSEKILIHQDIIKDLITANYLFILIFLTMILLITISFIMSILTQVLFDDFLKKNFDMNLYFLSNQDTLLKELRLKSVTKLKEENNKFNDFDDKEYTDYFLYQILGRKLQFFKYPTSTTTYIDDIKASGIISLSFIITFLIQMSISFSIYYILLIIFIYCMTYYYLKSRYRARAIRIYINYLIGDISNIIQQPLD